MASPSEIAVIVTVALVVATPWILALVLAVKDMARNPSWFTYLLAGAVVLGSTPLAFVYLAYRAWRGTELEDELNQASAEPVSK